MKSTNWLMGIGKIILPVGTAVTVATFLFAQPLERTPAPMTRAQVETTYRKLPLSFELNQGQTDTQVQFLARTDDYTVFLTSTEAVMVFPQSSENSRPIVLRLTFLDANANPEVTGLDKLPGKSNYFLGQDPINWHTNIPTYAKVQYQNLYPGIDLLYYGTKNELEYDFVVHPKTDPKVITFQFEGIEKLELDSQGNLLIHIADSIFQQEKPHAYQELKGKKQSIAIEYVFKDKEIGFKLADYDPSKPLIIDPVLRRRTAPKPTPKITDFHDDWIAVPKKPVIGYSTYLGGSGDDMAAFDPEGLTIDTEGYIYIGGTTKSFDFPTKKAFQQNHGGGGMDAFVAKFTPDGSALVYSTYLGGSGDDLQSYEGIYDIAVDTNYCVYVAGITNSADFPLQNPFQETPGGGVCGLPFTPHRCPDAFVTKLSPDGSALVYSTYLGGQGIDVVWGIAVDVSGSAYCAYVTGHTCSNNFPTTQHVFQPEYSGGGDAFVTKFTPDGSELIYSTYLGGYGGQDKSTSITVDNTGSAYITGSTRSHNFPIANPFQPTHGGGYEDAFVTKFTPDGSALIYSTYLGGNKNDGGMGIAIDESKNIYLTGYTYSTNFPIENAFQPAKGGGWDDAFLTKFTSGGCALVYSTYLGGSGDDGAYALALDTNNSAYVVGFTTSENFPIKNSFQPYGGGWCDAFVTKFTPNGSALIYSTYLGGSANDYATDIAVGILGHVYVRGGTQSIDFPLVNPFQDTLGGGWDSFVTKIAEESGIDYQAR